MTVNLTPKILNSNLLTTNFGIDFHHGRDSSSTSPKSGLPRQAK